MKTYIFTLCKKCGKSFKKLKKEISINNFCSRSCSVSYHNHLKPKRPKQGRCKTCNQIISTSRSYCGSLCRPKREKKIRTTADITKNITRWKQRQKLKAVEYKGGQCQCCGYNRCNNVLTFHHLDPSKKEFSISGKSAKSLKWEHRVKELDKCILLCMNCHGETHAGLHPEYLSS